MTATGLVKQPEEVQVNTLIYSMGDEADDILKSFSLEEEDSKKYHIVKGKFESHFVKRRNTIYERAKFNQRKQEVGEPVDNVSLHFGRTLPVWCSSRRNDKR